MYTKTTSLRGRLCNQIIRNLCVSLIAKKHNLLVSYSEYDKITEMGLELFVGKKFYNETKVLNDDNFFYILNACECHYNLEPNSNYFQTYEITNYLFNYLNETDVKNKIINKNPFKDRYNNNNDCFIHIRLTDASQHCPSCNYFINVIKSINFDKIYIASDDITNNIVKQLLDIFPSIEIIDYNEVETIQFGSTCKNVILSHGTYSAMIGYLAFYSTIYCRNIDKVHLWHGDIFSINNCRWNKTIY